MKLLACGRTGTAPRLHTPPSRIRASTPPQIRVEAHFAYLGGREVCRVGLNVVGAVVLGPGLHSWVGFMCAMWAPTVLVVGWMGRYVCRVGPNVVGGVGGFGMEWDEVRCPE